MTNGTDSLFFCYLDEGGRNDTQQPSFRVLVWKKDSAQSLLNVSGLVCFFAHILYIEVPSLRPIWNNSLADKKILDGPKFAKSSFGWHQAGSSWLFDGDEFTGHMKISSPSVSPA